MNYEVGDIVTVVTPVGEIVGRLKEIADWAITISRPRLFVAQEGGQGFAPGVCMTGEMHPEEVTFYKTAIVCTLLTHDDLATGWTEATSSIVL